MNKYGYPDIGNNRYAEELPYASWLKVNNAQRAHESLVLHLPIIYSTSFVNALVFPRYTFYMTSLLLVARGAHIRGYLSERGFNKAVAAEEVQLWLLKVMCLSAMVSSVRVLLRK